jgi:hypothetical protein
MRESQTLRETLGSWRDGNKENSERGREIHAHKGHSKTGQRQRVSPKV